MTEHKESAILLLSCPDQKGIVAEVSSFIYQYQGNIITAEQHTDRSTGTYFMRIEWELDGFAIPRKEIGEVFKHLAKKFSMDWSLYFSNRLHRAAIFVSKYNHCLYDLLLRNKSGELQMEIPLIISNHSDLESIANNFEIPFHYFPIQKSTKAEQEEKEISLLKKHKIDTVILARYMQIISPNFIQHYPNRIINIHHSFLPAFVGAKPYHQAFERGVKIIGATSHYINENLDQGPIIEQDVVSITHRDRVEDIIRKGKDLEKVVLSRAVKQHLENKVLVSQNKTVVFA